MPLELQTSRTILRPFKLDDAKNCTWFRDPLVMKYTPYGPDPSLKMTKKRLTHYVEHQDQYGCSKWLIVDRHSMQAIGDCGPMFFPEFHCFELGYRLLPNYWRQGFATEVASAWIKNCFENLGHKKLMAFSHPDNTASLRILEKLGFELNYRALVMGMPSKVFTLTYRKLS